MQRLVIFDIDHTLVSIGEGNRPQQQALDIAFEEVYGVPNAFRDVGLTGGMDLPMMIAVCRNQGLIDDGAHSPPRLAGFKATYFENLTMLLSNWTKGLICPGVPALLEALASEATVQLGLETGNFREAAFIKLRKFGLDSFFEDGRFGGDFTEREQVVADAISSCQVRSGKSYGLE